MRNVNFIYIEYFENNVINSNQLRSVLYSGSDVFLAPVTVLALFYTRHLLSTQQLATCKCRPLVRGL